MLICARNLTGWTRWICLGNWAGWQEIAILRTRLFSGMGSKAGKDVCGFRVFLFFFLRVSAGDWLAESPGHGALEKAVLGSGKPKWNLTNACALELSTSGEESKVELLL